MLPDGIEYLSSSAHENGHFWENFNSIESIGEASKPKRIGSIKAFICRIFGSCVVWKYNRMVKVQATNLVYSTTMQKKWTSSSPFNSIYWNPKSWFRWIEEASQPKINICTCKSKLDWIVLKQSVALALYKKNKSEDRIF